MCFVLGSIHVLYDFVASYNKTITANVSAGCWSCGGGSRPVCNNLRHKLLPLFPFRK